MEKFSIGIDIGGSKTKSVLMQNGAPVKFFETRYDNRKLNETEMEEILRKSAENFNVSADEIKGIGIAVPSAVIDGKPLRLHINEALQNLDLYNLFKGKLGAPVFIENDVNLAALGEWHFGFKKQPESLFLINLGTGCGAGFVKNGKIQRGFRSSAFELGHMPMGVKNGYKCGCGALDHIESYLSGRFFKNQGLDSFEEIKKAKNGDENSSNLFKNYGFYIGNAAALVANLIEPEIIALTGGLADAAEFFISSAEEALKQNLFLSPDNCKIHIAKTKNDAAVLGAALLAGRSS